MNTFNLTQEQEVIVSTWDQSIAVLAGAGCGKTSTLKAKCERLLELNPDARYLAVSFTEKSTEDLKVKLPQGNQSKNWIKTIHGFCAAVVREFPESAGFDGEERLLNDSEMQSLWQRVCEPLWLGEVQSDLTDALEVLLKSESQDQCGQLFKRVRDLEIFGVFDFLVKSARPEERALSKVGQYLCTQFENIKKKQGVLDFSDLEKGAIKVIQNKEVLRHLRSRFDLILVDEFQDTNLIQANLIWTISKNDQSNLLVVGDPKQSIYRFRDADLTVFDEYTSRLKNKFSLTLNFRSHPRILQFVNQVCEPVFTNRSMKYESLNPGRIDFEEDLDAVTKLTVKSPEDLALYIKNELSQGVPITDFAILLRRVRGGGERWIRSLLSHGVPLSIGSGGLFWSDPRVQEIVSFLNWWKNPSNTLSGSIFLRSPWVSFSLEWIETVISKGQDFKTAFLESGHVIAQVLNDNDDQSVSDTLLKLLANQEIENEIAVPLLGLWHRAIQLEINGKTPYEIIFDWNLAKDENRREREVSPPKNTGISVLTLHGAKGLEFPVVILVDFNETPARAEDSPMLYWNRNQGVSLGFRDEDGNRDAEKEEPWRTFEKERALDEVCRLFYVALTRAMRKLVLCFEEPKKESKIFPKEEIYKKDFWRGWIEHHSSLDSKSLNLKNIELPLQLSLSEAKLKTPKWTLNTSHLRIRQSVTEWNVLSQCPRLYAYKFNYIQKTSDPKILPEVFTEQKTVSQRDLGTRVHEVLEDYNLLKLKELENEVGKDRLNADLINEWFHSSTLTAQVDRSYSEVSFEVPVSATEDAPRLVLIGSIDRIVKKSENEYWIIDYKVLSYKKSEAELLDSYQTQLQLYKIGLQMLEPQAKVIKTFLVAISPGEVREIEVQSFEKNLAQRLHLESISVQREASLAQARSNSGCKFCEFSADCPEYKP